MIGWMDSVTASITVTVPIHFHCEVRRLNDDMNAHKLYTITRT